MESQDDLDRVRVKCKCEWLGSLTPLDSVVLGKAKQKFRVKLGLPPFSKSLEREVSY